jgi:predicted Zn-dependent protease with MMP-like domain
MGFHVSQQKFGELVERALTELPAEFARLLEEVSVEIRPRPTAQELKSLGLKAGAVLLGLYKGRPRTVRSVEDSGRLPDVIYVFQENIEQISQSEQQLVQQVRKTVLHEVGHHFGMDEDDLDNVGFG